MTRTVPIAKGQKLASVLSCLASENSFGPLACCSYVCDGADPTLTGFDRATFIDAIDDEVIGPMRDTVEPSAAGRTSRASTPRGVPWT